MNAVRLVAGVCMLALGGCQAHAREPNTESAETLLPQKGQARMLEIKRFALDKDYLRVDYSVHNLLPHDIWICDDIDTESPGRDVEIRIMDDTLRIRLRFNLERNFDHERVFAGYRFLRQGQSYSGMVRLRLPVKNWSPLYVVDSDFHAPERLVTLHFAIFEVGYFGEDLPTLISQSRERGWYVPRIGIWQPASEDPHIVSISDFWQGVNLEQSILATIDHVQIPARLGGLEWPGPSPAADADRELTGGDGSAR
jgi:hypothetical protein